MLKTGIDAVFDTKHKIILPCQSVVIFITIFLEEYIVVLWVAYFSSDASFARN
jgi:hypothetical protein